MLSGDQDLARLEAAAPIFAALGDPVRLSIVRRLCESGSLPTIQLQDRVGGLSRQGITKHLRVLEDAGLVESSRLGRDRQWQLQARQFTDLRACLDQISAQWDVRLRRLQALLEESDG